jgi:gas vesicle protein
MSDDKANSLGGLLVAFLAGAAVGAAVALLTSPKSGPEIRETLASGIKDLGTKIRDTIGEHGSVEASPKAPKA